MEQILTEAGCHDGQAARLSNDMNWLLLQNSLLVSGCAMLAAVALGFAAAVCLAGLPGGWRNGFLILTVSALALPPFLVTNCWLHYLGAAGAWRGWLPFNLFSLGGTIWILALMLWPIPALAVWSAWQKLQPSHLEAEPALTGLALVRWLLLPMAAPALGISAVLAFVLAMNNFAVPAILQTKVFPAEVWVQFNTTLDPGVALRTSWPLIALPAAMLLLFWRREIAWPRASVAFPTRSLRRQLGGAGFWFCGTITLLLCLFSVGLPLMQLATATRTWTELPSALAAGQGAAWNSFSWSALAATACVGLGLAGWRWRIGALWWLPFFVPGVLLGIGLIAAFNRPPFLAFYRSAGIVVLALVIRYLALGWQGAALARRAVDRDLTDAARMDGATPWQLLRFIQGPQIGPQVTATWYVVYLLCLWDVETLVLVIPPGGETLALRVFNLLHYGHNAQVNALCLTLLGLAVAPLVAWGALRGLRRLTASRFQVALAAASALALLATGCSQQTTPTRAPVESRFFSEVQTIGSRGVAPGEFSKPRSVAVDREDNLYVADMTGRVQKFSPDGRYLLSWQLPQTDLGKPKGMARDAAGNILVIEPHYQRVNHFTPAGKLVAQWGVSGTNAGQFKLPRAVAVNSRGEIFVSEYGLVERVQRFAVAKTADPTRAAVAATATLLAGLGRPGTGPGEFNRPEGLGVDAHDQLYVADSCNHRIQVFSSGGGFVRQIGKAGKGSGELSYPYDVCVDAKGNIFVCEFGNSRIQIFDPQGQPVEIIGHAGAEPGCLANPWGVALDSKGNLYVADSQNHRVQKFIRKPGATVGEKVRRPKSEGRNSKGPPLAGRVWDLMTLVQSGDSNWRLKECWV